MRLTAHRQRGSQNSTHNKVVEVRVCLFPDTAIYEYVFCIVHDPYKKNAKKIGKKHKVVRKMFSDFCFRENFVNIFSKIFEFSTKKSENFS